MLPEIEHGNYQQQGDAHEMHVRFLESVRKQGGKVWKVHKEQMCAIYDNRAVPELFPWCGTCGRYIEHKDREIKPGHRLVGPCLYAGRTLVEDVRPGKCQGVTLVERTLDGKTAVKELTGNKQDSPAV
jgi:hypothetical protein